MQQKQEGFILYFKSLLLPYEFLSWLIRIVKLILFLETSTASTCTSTISPTLTASRGCLMKRSGNMHQSVLMDANIHKHTEVYDVSDGSFQDHTGL